MQSRSSPARLARWLETLFLLTLLGGTMAAQTKLTVQDSLKEVRIFDQTSAEFAKIAADLGVSASLASLGQGASVVAAVRNDSGQAVEMRILFHIAKGGKTVREDVEVNRQLAAGEVTLVAPPQIAGALAGLLNAGRPGLIASTAQSLDAYQGTEVTISIDSATLANGKFIGPDTATMFNDLVAEDKAKRRFFSDLTGWLSAGKTQAQIAEALAERQSKNRLESQAAISESALTDETQNWLERRGMTFLATWAADKSTALAAKPSIHK